MNMGSSMGRGASSSMGGFPIGGIFGDSFAQQQQQGGGIPMHHTSQQQRPQQQPAQQQKLPPIEHQLQVSLEDLYNGATKKMRITKKTLNGGTAATDKVRHTFSLYCYLALHLLQVRASPHAVASFIHMLHQVYQVIMLFIMSFYHDARYQVITIRPGWKTGTRVTFESEGDETANGKYLGLSTHTAYIHTHLPSL